MARDRQPRGGQEDVAPEAFPETPPPRYSQPGHDFTLQAVMEMQRTLGQFTAKIDRLVEDVGKLGGKIGDVEKDVHTVKVGAVVALGVLTVVGGILWWAIGDRVTSAVHAALSGTPAVQATPNPVPLPPSKK